MHRVLFVLLLMVVFLFNACKKDDGPTEPGDPDPNGEEALLEEFRDDEAPGVVKVMSRNVYVGTDVDIILEAENVNEIPILVATAFQILQQTNFAERANTLATEIAKTKPHLVGLQEMSKIMRQTPGDFGDGNPVAASDTIYNYFTIMMNALNAKGLNYRIASWVQNADVELPMATSLTTYDDIRLIDHDVILARNDVEISDPISKSYANFLEVAGIIAVKRGYAAVTAKIGEDSYRFVSTHLEAVDDEQLRRSQAEELAADFAGETLPVIVVGDFNTVAPGNTTYQYFASQGYVDTWDHNTLTYNTNGYTFGHQADLRNATPAFGIRIDFIFLKADTAPDWGTGFVLGDELRDRTASGMWPSDHGGVVIKFQY